MKQLWFICILIQFTCHNHFHNFTYFYNSINWTSFLAKSTIYTFSHVNIISCCSSASISPLFSFYGDGLMKHQQFSNTTFFNSINFYYVHTWFVSILISQNKANSIQLFSKVFTMFHTCAGQIASQSLQAIHRSSPEGYLLNACSPRKRGLRGPFSKG